MTNKKILKQTLEENGYDLSALIRPCAGLEGSIIQAMNRAQSEINSSWIKTSIEPMENLINEFKKECLPDANEPFHHEAEIAAGFKHFIEWLKKKSKIKK